MIFFFGTPFPALSGPFLAEVTTIFASMLKTQRIWYLEDHPTARFSGETLVMVSPHSVGLSHLYMAEIMLVTNHMFPILFPHFPILFSVTKQL